MPLYLPTVVGILALTGKGVVAMLAISFDFSAKAAGRGSDFPSPLEEEKEISGEILRKSEREREDVHSALNIRIALSGFLDGHEAIPPGTVVRWVWNYDGKLNQYWEEFVKEQELMPQNEGVNLRKRWLYSGNNYRRMFEPLDIAKYYESGKGNYIENRPNRYKLLEQWWNEDKKDLNPNERKEGPNVNDDSCFWAHVEEALISLRILTNGSSSTDIDEIEPKYNFMGYVMHFWAHVEEALISLRILTRARSSINVDEIEQKLDNFIPYVMHSVNNYSLSSDIFLEGSSLMKWWSEYDVYKTGLCTSKFAKYMKSGEYKSYQ
ncbi:senescence-associated carboxylesterase 101-like [Bidens hawaiensis]|uniref:senescence-associated carboxylesterase 101-like n=1 Tax=Bidens hawaiensis TaxID=980011 RepID=UPI00404ACF9C